MINIDGMICPKPGDEVWAVYYAYKRNKNQLLLKSRKEVCLYRGIVSNINLYQGEDDDLTWDGELAVEVDGVFRQIHICASNSAYSEQAGNGMLEHFLRHGGMYLLTGYETKAITVDEFRHAKN